MARKTVVGVDIRQCRYNMLLKSLCQLGDDRITLLDSCSTDCCIGYVSWRDIMGFEWGWDDIDWIAVVVSVIASMALGFIWYSKFAFLKMWQEDTGMTDEKMRSGNMPMMFGGMIVLVIVSTISLALLIGTGDIEAGLAIGALVGFGVTAARVVPQFMFAQQPNRFAMLQAANLGIGITLTGAIIGAFN